MPNFVTLSILDVTTIIFLVILAFIMIVVSQSVRIISQSDAYVVERLGAYNRTLEKGLHFIVPFIERVANRVTLKEIVKDFAPQPVITADNVTMQIDTVVYFQITDPKLYTYGVHNPINAIENLTATTLRNIIGDLELDQTLTSRDIINTKMRSILDEATDPWGIRVSRVEVKNILPPRDIQDAMEKQMRAERERREAILRAEGEKASKILVAEGQKEAMILNARAKKEAMIEEAIGQKEAMEKVYDAQVYGIEKIKNAYPSEEYLKLKAFETMSKVADGKSTKLILPSELTNLGSLLAASKHILNSDPVEPTNQKPGQ